MLFVGRENEAGSKNTLTTDVPAADGKEQTNRLGGRKTGDGTGDAQDCHRQAALGLRIQNRDATAEKAEGVNSIFCISLLFELTKMVILQNEFFHLIEDKGQGM